MKKSIAYSLLIIPALVLLIMSVGCKKFTDPGVADDQYKPDSINSSTFLQRKVLLISIDGLDAAVFRLGLPANMNTLLQNAKYTNMLQLQSGPDSANNASSWVSTLSGNDQKYTRVYDSTFYPLPIDTVNKIAVPLSPSVINYIHTQKLYKEKVAVVSPWPNLVNNFLYDADTKIVTTNDLDTKNKLVSTISTGSQSLIISQFTGMINVDTLNTSFYTQSLKTIDGYIGEIMAALKSRPTYSKENWLVMITNNEVSPVLTKINKVAPFVIAYNQFFKSENVWNLKPPVSANREATATNILYWLRVPKSTVVRATDWLSRFEIEFLGK